MPFYNNVYYPYQLETQGTHSSAGIPSLLNSPLSQPTTSSGQCGIGPPPPAAMSTSTATTIPPFKFRPRRESVDWRRISAVDVDLVASELDFHTLQEHISGVTFCSVEGERCPRCQSPVDPALLKLFRLAQLTVEYLLHSQEYLTLSLQAAEERLQEAARHRDQLLAQQQKQADESKALKTELKQRKKMIASQQAMIATRLNNCQKCQHCDKAFMNSSFLQNHMQRRHPEEYDVQLRTDNQKKVQTVALEEQVSSLKEQLHQQQQQQQALLAKTSQEKDQQSMQDELMRKLARWKEEEMVVMNRKVEEAKEGFRREVEAAYARTSLLEKYLDYQNALPESRGSPAPRHPERDVYLEKCTEKDIQTKFQWKLKKKEEKWESRMQEMKAGHDSEKNELLNELSKMQWSMSQQQEQSQRLREELDQQLQEHNQAILSHREQIRHISSNPPIKVVEIPAIITAPAPEPKPKRVVCEQPPSAPKLEPIEELSEEEKDSSSISEKRAEVRKPEVKRPPVTSVLRKNPNIKKELRPALEQALIEKLEALGVKPGLSGLRSREYSDIMAKVHSERESAASAIPDYWSHREDVARTLAQRLKEKRTGSDSAPEQRDRPKHSAKVIQGRSRSSSLPSRVTHVMSGPPTKQLQLQPPQPAPRSRTSTLPKSSTPKTPPFSSDEESSEEDEEEDDPPPQRRQEHRFPQSKAPQVKQIQSRPAQARTTPTHVKAPPSKPQQPKAPVANVTKTAFIAVESEGEWSEGSEMEEIDPQMLKNYKDQNGNVEKTANNNLVKDLTKSLERQLADRGTKKPVGGVSTLPERKDVVRELKYKEIEEDDDWDISSLEDLAVPAVSKPAQSSAPTVRKSLDSSNTSVWGMSTEKGQKTGLNEAGTGSTLKSSLISVSDWSDSDEI